MSDPAGDVPEVPILLLGDAGVGKSTFLSRLRLGQQNNKLQIKDEHLLRDFDQPFLFDIRFSNRQFRFQFYDTASPENYTLLRPAVIILCYSIAEPESLESIQANWKGLVETHYNYDEQMPVILLGLMRDVRQKEDYDGRVKPMQGDGNSDTEVLNGRRFVYPQEALNVAQEMRCDRYCECSALTGELCREVFEDIAKSAAMTTTAEGGKTNSEYCSLM